MFLKNETENFWETDECALVFADQTISIPYRRAIDDLELLIAAEPGSIWLDLGCGSGQLVESIWRKSEGLVKKIIGLDCAYLNNQLFYQRSGRFCPLPEENQVEFIQADFRLGLPQFPNNYIDGVTAGFCLAYADHWDGDHLQWTRKALDQLLKDINRVLKPNGQFIFLTNILNVNFFKIISQSLFGALKEFRFIEIIKKVKRMSRFTKLIHAGISQGRFHYLSIEDWSQILRNFHFDIIKYKLTCADQAYLIKAIKI